MKDIADRIGMREADYVRVFQRWITALPHKLQYIFKTRDEKVRAEKNQMIISYENVTSDFQKVLVDCSDMFSGQIIGAWKNTPVKQTDLCKFVMGVSFPTGYVVHVSDVSADDGVCMIARVGQGNSTIIVPFSESNSWLVQGQTGNSPLENILSRVRSFRVLDNSEVKLQCQTFRSVFKVCLLLSNVIQQI